MAETRHALILAAGEGNRLRPLTLTVPKPLVPVNGIPMLDRAMSALRDAGVDHFTIVVGHLEQAIRHHLRAPIPGREVEIVSNPHYHDSNSMFSLLLGLAKLDAPSWIVEGDVVFDANVFSRALLHPVTWAVDSSARHMDGAFVDSDSTGRALAVEIVRDTRAIKSGAGKSVGMLHANRDGIGTLRRWLALDLLARREMDYYDLTIGRRLPDPAVGTLDIAGSRWYEVDNVDDLARAEALFP